MTASEYFAALADAVREHRKAELLLTFGQPRGGDTVGGSASVSDPVLARAIYDEAARAILEATEDVIGDGLRVIANLRRIYPGMAEVLELKYIDLLTWAQVADELNIGASTARLYQSLIFKFVDSVGLARIRELV